MREPRVERVVEELHRTVERLNRLNSILVKSNTTFVLHRTTRTGSFVLDDIHQLVDYTGDTKSN